MPNVKATICNPICPVCGGSKAMILKYYTSRDVAKHMKISENDPKFEIITAKVENLWESDSCCFMHCESCTFDFAFPNISGDSNFYNLIYDHDLNYPKWKWDFGISYSIIEEIIENKPNDSYKLLEIGAGNGNFIKKIASNLIPKDSILATEFSSFGKSEITNLGIHCLSVDIYDLEIQKYNYYFDFVCLFQVLEHISDLNIFFDRITLLTKKGANLLITVPNNTHRIHFMNLGIDEDIPPIHVGRWNKSSFSILAEKYGWIVINHTYQPSNYLGNLLKYIFKKYEGLDYLNFVHGIKNKLFHKIALVLVLLPLLFINLKTIICLFKKDLGISQFVHLKKPK